MSGGRDRLRNDGHSPRNTKATPPEALLRFELLGGRPLLVSKQTLTAMALEEVVVDCWCCVCSVCCCFE